MICSLFIEPLLFGGYQMFYKIKNQKPQENKEQLKRITVRQVRNTFRTRSRWEAAMKNKKITNTKVKWKRNWQENKQCMLYITDIISHFFFLGFEPFHFFFVCQSHAIMMQEQFLNFFPVCPKLLLLCDMHALLSIPCIRQQNSV